MAVVVVAVCITSLVVCLVLVVLVAVVLDQKMAAQPQEQLTGVEAAVVLVIMETLAVLAVQVWSLFVSQTRQVSAAVQV
jgi:hypothetical protein